MPKILLLVAMHKRDPAANADKVCGVAILALDGARIQYLAFNGRRGQPRARALTTHPRYFSSMPGAQQEAAKKARTKRSEGYENIDWRDDYYGLVEFVRDLDPQWAASKTVQFSPKAQADARLALQRTAHVFRSGGSDVGGSKFCDACGLARVLPVHVETSTTQTRAAQEQADKAQQPIPPAVETRPARTPVSTSSPLVRSARRERDLDI